MSLAAARRPTKPGLRAEGKRTLLESADPSAGVRRREIDRDGEAGLA